MYDYRYDVLVHHTDQIEQDINEPYPEVELRTESVAPQMDPIAEEGEEGSHVDDEVWRVTSKELKLHDAVTLNYVKEKPCN